MTKAELARKAGISPQQFGRLEDGKRKLTQEWAEVIAKVLRCTPRELMFPETTTIDDAKFNRVTEILEGTEDDGDPSAPTAGFAERFLTRFLPSVAGHHLQLMIIESTPAGGLVEAGDAVVVDASDKVVGKPGLYLLRIAGATQLRYLTPTTTGSVQVHSDVAGTPPEIADPRRLEIMGRARLRISKI